MPTDSNRVLIVDDERAMLANLSDYLTFRGWRVDRAHSWSDARALMHHIRYDAIVVGVLASNRDVAGDFAREARGVAKGARLIAVADALAALTDDDGAPIDFDEVLGRHLPISHLGRHLTQCIAA